MAFFNLLILSCRHQPQVEDFETSIGRIGQAELVHRFGYPQRLKRLGSGAEVWDYEFLSGGSRCVGYRVFFDEDQQSRSWERIPCR
ncbi:MAG: hypothetical protein CV090_14005 [Nitrospira sp. WS238]|nr:hypothetical protein [Nitrospira sp. WS238]